MRAMAVDLDLSDVALSADEPARLTATLRVPAAHAVLAGHFPGAPLVPGVLLLAAARRATERALAQPLAIAVVDAARFYAPVAPDVAVRLIADCARHGHGWQLTGEWLGEVGRVATFGLVLTPCAPADA